MGAHLSVHGLGKRYGSLPVLRGWDLEVRRGERLVLVGPSGCGKTTFVRIAAGLEAPSEGTLRCDARRVGFVFQEARLIPWRNVGDNLRFVNPDADCRGTLARLGLAGCERLLPAQLSGGMRQRVNLARALVAEPDLLILDEAFAALDLRIRMAVIGEVQRLWQERDFTMVAVAHDPKEALLLADRILLLSARPAAIVGEMAVELGPRRHLATPELLRLEAHLVDVICGLDEASSKAPVA